MASRSQSGPIFLGGAGRSGTTLLRVMLDMHPRIFCGPELKILPAIAEWYQALTRDFVNVIQSYYNSPADLQRCFREFIEGLVENARTKSGKPRWAEKTPHNVIFMRPLGELFPDARFIHMIRDGRDVACSLLTMDWLNPLTGRKWDYVQNMASAARYWCEVVTAGRQMAAHPSIAGRVLELRYEALVADPEAVMRHVLDFVGEPWHPVVLSYHTKIRDQEPFEASTAQASKPVTDRSIGRWRRDMTATNKAAFQAEAGELLGTLGYAGADW
jgi:hypothetical protein